MVETKSVQIGVALILLAGFDLAFCAEQSGESSATSDVFKQEWNAYYHPTANEKQFHGQKTKYLQKLSMGGRIYFLANRKDFDLALTELQRFPKNGTASALYVRAICLDGLKKYTEAVQSFAAAQSKIDLVFHPGPKFYLQYATALMHAQKFSDALKNLDIAAQMGKSGVDKGGRRAYEMSGTVRKRKAAIFEMQGRYKEALSEYISLCGKNASHFKLDSPMKTSVAELVQQRQALQQKGSQIDYQTKCKLVRIDYELGKFKECCKTMRSIAGNGLTDEFDTYFTTVSMRDVPQLVLQEDVELHSIDLEEELDFVDYLRNPLTPAKSGAKYQ
ncbi:MAG: hypothetical protein C0469_17760 [Cyanobacteria bacterium DS2.3.42]|nr:hypothetical protein [Cyanobacteria bacterium DS2.3.42]